jgi:hypothetical protein
VPNLVCDGWGSLMTGCCQWHYIADNPEATLPYASAPRPQALQLQPLSCGPQHGRTRHPCNRKIQGQSRIPNSTTSPWHHLQHRTAPCNFPAAKHQSTHLAQPAHQLTQLNQTTKTCNTRVEGLLKIFINNMILVRHGKNKQSLYILTTHRRARPNKAS